MQTFENTAGSNISFALPKDVTDVLSNVAFHLHMGRHTTAMDVIRKAKTHSPWVVNAHGVCYLRQGNAEKAVEVFRGLVIGAGGLQLRADAPTTFKANLAAALPTACNVPGCQTILSEIRNDGHSAVQNVRREVARWREGLSFGKR